MKLASFFDDNIVSALGTVNRGVKEAAFVVIKKNTVPAVLIELGFLTNWNDFSMVTDEDSQNQGYRGPSHQALVIIAFHVVSPRRRRIQAATDQRTISITPVSTRIPPETLSVLEMLYSMI